MTESDDQQDDAAFEALLEYLKESRGFDFTGYKRSSVQRRVERRMQQVEVGDYGEYLDRLQVDQNEFTQLFNTILINVTGFFRDPEAWRELQQEIVPSLVGAKTRGESIRVWSAGCASGEEAYTLAILLAEQLGAEEFRRRVKVYATDVDEDALAIARQATYAERDLQAVPEELRERYFESNGSRYTFRGDLRHSVIFGRNDLVQDAPIGRLDLLVCRNSLMYLNAETQAQVLRRFHFALNPTGVLFLGKAEMLLSHAKLFLPIDLKRRFFRKADQVDPAQRLALAHGEGNGRSGRESPLEDEALLLNPLATVVVNGDEVVAKANQRAEAQLAVSSREIGRRFPDLDLCGRINGLRGAYDDVRRNRNPMWLHEVPFSRSATETLYFDIQLVPLEAAGSGTGAAVAIFFSDVTRYQRLTAELQAAHRQVETAYEELQSTVEELETTNEELQSTVEELETTNEELQSTVEELETTNEELQSTNDELQSMNDELRDRTNQLDHANDFLESVLGSLRTAVLVVDTELIVRAWNGRADDLWGLRADETVGQHLLNLDIGLPTERLRPLVRAALSGAAPGEQELRLEAINRRGRTVQLVVSASPMRLRGSGPTGAIVLMDQDGGSEPALPAPPS